MPFHRFFITSKVLYNCKYHPSLGHSQCHSFVRRSPPPRSTPWGAYRSQGCHIMVTQWHSDPIQNAHILPLAITARYQFHTLVRWGRHRVHILPKDVTLVSQLGARRFEPTISAFRVPHAIHSATTSPFEVSIIISNHLAYTHFEGR